MSWCFALVNGRLAEVFFDNEKKSEPKIFGHCYVRKEEYKTKREQKMIENDTNRFQLSYSNKMYRDKIKNKILKTSDPRRLK